MLVDAFSPPIRASASSALKFVSFFCHDLPVFARIDGRIVNALRWRPVTTSAATFAAAVSTISGGGILLSENFGAQLAVKRVVF